MSKKKEDFLSMWKKDTKKTPSTSIIAGLQQQIAQKDEEIEHLNEKIISLKTRINEDIQIMEQTEGLIKTQQQELDRLKSRGGSRGSTTLEPARPSPSVTDDILGRSSTKGASSEEIRNYKNRIKELEDKVYIFSQLPDRITKLEERNAKLSQMIDEFERNEKKLMDTIKKLTLGDGEESVMAELQETIGNQKIRIKALEERLQGTGGGDDLSLDLSSVKEEKLETELKSLRQSLVQLTTANNDLKAKLEEASRARTEQEAKNEVLRKTVSQLQASGGDKTKELKDRLVENEQVIQDLAAQVSSLTAERDTLRGQVAIGGTAQEIDKLQSDNKKLQEKVETLESKYQEATLRFENLVAKVQESQKGDSSLQKLHDVETELAQLKDAHGTLEVDFKELKDERDRLAGEAMDLKKDLEKAKGTKATPSPLEAVDGSSKALVEDLQKKLNRQKTENEKLREELGKVEGIKGKAADTESLQARVKELEERLSMAEKASSGGDLQALVNDLQKRLSNQKKLTQKLQDDMTSLEKFREAGQKAKEMESRIKKLEAELEQAQEAKPSAATSSSPLSAGDLSGLVQDLQRKVNHTKVALRNREERIKELEEDLRDFRAKEEVLNKKMQTADERLTKIEVQEAKLDDIAREMAELKQALQEKSELYDNVCQERDSVQSNLAQTKNILSDREAELKELEDRVASLREALAAK